jgi:hypothetical protein
VKAEHGTFFFGVTVGFLFGSVAAGSMATCETRDKLCKQIAAGQEHKALGNECYVVRDGGVLEPVRRKP